MGCGLSDRPLRVSEGGLLGHPQDLCLRGDPHPQLSFTKGNCDLPPSFPVHNIPSSLRLSSPAAIFSIASSENKGLAI